MKDLETCLDELGDESFVYSGTVIDFVDQQVTETCIAGMYKSFLLKDDASLNTFARSLMQQLQSELLKRAELMQQKSISPLDTKFDELRDAA